VGGRAWGKRGSKRDVALHLHRFSKESSSQQNKPQEMRRVGIESPATEMTCHELNSEFYSQFFTVFWLWILCDINVTHTICVKEMGGCIRSGVRA